MAIDLMLSLRIAYLAIGTSISMTYYALKGLISRPPSLPYKQYLLARWMWCMRAYDKHRRIPSKAPTTTLGSYVQYTRSDAFTGTSKITELDHGGYLLWFGPEQAEKVIYFLHGGAYVNPASPLHYKMLEDLIACSKRHGHSLRVAVLAYDLVPKSAFPKQLIQAVTGLDALVQDFNYSISKIILIGDSAGGHLALSLLSHALHPHPSIPRITSLTKDSKVDFLGIFLISPWVTFKQDAQSMFFNQNYDFLHKPALKISSNQFLNGGKDDNYNDFLLPVGEWWKDLASRNIGFTAGGCEIFRDDIVKMAKIFQSVIKETQLVDVPGEVHEAAILYLSLEGEKAESLKVLEGWVIQALDRAI